MSQRDFPQRLEHEREPVEKPVKVIIYRDCVRFDFYSSQIPERKYKVKLPREQAELLLSMVADALANRGPRQFLLGFTPEDLAFHRIDAVEAAVS